MKKIFLLTTLLSLFSCGIIRSKKDYLSIDSEPRGLLVYRQVEGKEAIDKIGSTPMFLEVKKGSEDLYIMKDPYSKNRSVNTSPKRICRYHREGEQFIPEEGKKDDPGLVKNFVDSWTPKNILKGSSYECISIVKAKLKNTKLGKKEKTCRTYLIMPPRSSFLKISLDLANGWIDQVFNKHKQKCDKVITLAVSESQRLFLGIDDLNAPEDITELEYEKFLNLGSKFKATDLVFLPYQEKDKTFTVTPKIYDIHTAKKSSKVLTQKYEKKLKIGGGYKITSAILSTFRFIPNGVAFQQSFRNRYVGDGYRSYLFDQNYDNYVPGISLNNIKYPQYRWKGQTMIVPNIIWEYWGDKALTTDLYGLSMDIKFFLHLPPGGVIIARAGFGATYINAEYDQVGYQRKVGTWVAPVGVEYYFFPLKRFYLLTGYRRTFIPSVISGPGFEIKGESHIYLNIGYFWPEFRTAVRRWFNW